MTDREKVAQFIQNIKRAQQINGRWQIFVFCIMGTIALVYGNMKGGDLPRYLQVVFAVGMLSLVIPAFKLSRAVGTCPICGGAVNKRRGLFYKVCPYCGTDLDPDNEIHRLG